MKTRAPRRAVIEAFEQAVDVLANRQLISAEQAATLADLVGLMPGARKEPTGETIQFREPLAGTLLFDPCGELLEISAGELAFVSHTRIDATGGFHFQGHAQFVGVEATSVDSGAAYHLRSQTHDAVYFDPIDGLPAVQVNRFRFVLQPAEGGARTTLSARIHVTWTPGGDTPVVIIEDVQCEP